MSRITTIEHKNALELIATKMLFNHQKIVLVGLTFKETRDYANKVVDYIKEFTDGALSPSSHNRSYIAFPNGGIIYTRSFGRGDISCMGLIGHVFFIEADRCNQRAIDSISLCAYADQYTVTNIKLN